MQSNAGEHPATVGLDVGDRKSQLCRLDEAGKIAEEARIATTRRSLGPRFGEMAPLRVVLEGCAGTCSFRS